ESAALHQVDDELQLVEALEVGHLWRVSRFDQDFESFLRELCGSTTENHLLSKEVFFGFFCEGALKYASAGKAEGIGERERVFFGLARRIYVNGDEAGNTEAVVVGFAYFGARGFGRREPDIHAFGRCDEAVVYV